MFVKVSVITFFTSDKTHSEKENPWNVQELFLQCSHVTVHESDREMSSRAGATARF